jgi:hypothetical protein
LDEGKPRRVADVPDLITGDGSARQRFSQPVAVDASTEPSPGRRVAIGLRKTMPTVETTDVQRACLEHDSTRAEAAGLVGGWPDNALAACAGPRGHHGRF